MPLPVLDATGVKLLEPTSGGVYARFTLTLDSAPTAPVTVSYYTQDGSASSAQSDYSDTTGSITFATGQQTQTVSVYVLADSVTEPDETFSLVLIDPSNATLAGGGAAALHATATIIGIGSTTTVGVGAAAAHLTGPASASASLPTLSVSNESTIEGNGGGHYITFLATLDRVATAPVSFSYYTQDNDATSTFPDYDDTTGTATIAAGQQSVPIKIYVRGDIGVEGDQTFNVVLTTAANAVFAGGGAALVATGTILDDDSGPISGVGGIGASATPVLGAPPASPSAPTLTAYGASTHEGQSGGHYLRFLVALDQAPTTPVSVNYRFDDGTASSAAGDFNADAGTLDFAVGQRSAWVSAYVRGDTSIEPSETLKLTLSGVHGAVFAGNAPALVATGTILDDDSGSNPRGGIGAEAAQVIGPADTTTLPQISVVNASVAEGASGFYPTAGIYLLLSKASSTDVVVHYATSDGTATAGADYTAGAGDFTIPAGLRSYYLSAQTIGDTRIENDETFNVTSSNLRGAGFAGGAATANAVVTILDDDGGGSAGKTTAGPAFALALPSDPVVTAEVASVLRLDSASGAAVIGDLSGKLASGALTQATAAQAVVAAALSTTEVAALSYQFFTGRTPSAAGIDYLVSPTGPNPNNLNSVYYAKFDVTNRFINFASNLGKVGEGAAAFQSAYGALSLGDVTTKAYAAIFGAAPTADKVSHLLHDAVPNGLGGTYEREDYFASYGQDGLTGQGTKAALVGWLLGVAAQGDLGVYAKSDDALLLDVAIGKVSFGVDLIGTYAKPEYVYHG